MYFCVPCNLCDDDFLQETPLHVSYERTYYDLWGSRNHMSYEGVRRDNVFALDKLASVLHVNCSSRRDMTVHVSDIRVLEQWKVGSILAGGMRETFTCLDDTGTVETFRRWIVGVRSIEWESPFPTLAAVEDVDDIPFADLPAGASYPARVTYYTLAAEISHVFVEYLP